MIVSNHKNIVFFTHGIQAIYDEWDEFIGNAGEGLVKDDEEIVLGRCALKNQFEEKELALASGEARHEITGDGATDDYGICFMLLLQQRTCDITS